MHQLRHSKKISASLSVSLLAATSSITCFQSVSFAQGKNTADKKTIASVDSNAGPTANVAKKNSVATKPVNSKLVYPRTHFEKAYYFKQKHDLNNALIEFLKSTQENPLLVRAFYEQALIFRERGYLKLATASLEQALAVKPDYQDARILLATISIQQGNVGGAVRELTRSLGLENAIIKNDGQPGEPLTSVKKAVTEKVKDVDDAVDAAPTVVLQSIHSQLKYEKTLDSDEPSEHPSEAKPKSEIASVDSENNSETKIDETASKHFDLTSIKDSLRDSFEAAIHAPFSLATYWNHLPFGNPQLSEQSSISPIDENAALKVEDNSGSSKKEKRKKKKKNKKDRKHRESDVDGIENAAPKQTSEQTTETATTVRNDTPESTAALPEFVQKAIAEHKEAEENAQAAKQTPQDESNTLFASTDFSKSTHTLINGLKPTDGGKEVETNKTEPREQVHLDTDEWATRLKYLVDHGTNSLKEGEAFMFAEDTGEASLFLADGKVIRRIVQLPRDQTEIVRQRRPDMLIPDDLLYKLSLLGKLIPHPENPPMQSTAPAGNDLSSTPTTIPNIAPGATTDAGKDFSVDNVMGKSQIFWGWLKNAFKF